MAALEKALVRSLILPAALEGRRRRQVASRLHLLLQCLSHAGTVVYESWRRTKDGLLERASVDGI